MNNNIPGLLESARLGLRTTFRERAHLPSSPWFAYLGAYGGILIVNKDAEMTLAEWREVCRIDNSRDDDANMAKISAALWKIPTVVHP